MRFSQQSDSVLDAARNLVWGPELPPVKFRDAAKVAAAMAATTGLPWRLPTIEELMSLMDSDDTFQEPRSTFPGMSCAPLWSGTNKGEFSAFGINTQYGHRILDCADKRMAVRLVRDLPRWSDEKGFFTFDEAVAYAAAVAAKTGLPWRLPTIYELEVGGETPPDGKYWSSTPTPGAMKGQTDTRLFGEWDRGAFMGYYEYPNNPMKVRLILT